MIKLKKLIREAASSQTVAKRLKNKLSPYLYSKDRFEGSYMSEMEDLSYEEWLEVWWEDRLDRGSRAVKLDIKNWHWIPDLEEFKPYSNRKQEIEARNYFNNIVADLDWHVSAVRKRGRASKSFGMIITFRENQGEKVEVSFPLYHVSYFDNKDEILNKGLIPKEGTKTSFLYPERIYLFTEYNEQLFARFMFEKANINVGPEKRRTGSVSKPRYSIFKVKLGDTSSYNFFKDRDMKNSVYTNSKIPPQSIEHLKDVTV